DWLAARTRRADFLAELPAGAAKPTDFYQSLQLLPHLLPAETQKILDQPLPTARDARPDIICFSIVDWSFRFQRPQQLMTQFAANGHRVFYISLSKFRTIHARPKFAVTTIQSANEAAAGRLYEVALSTQAPLDVAGGVISKEDCGHLLESLDELRRAYNINEAVSYVMIPSWANAALETRRWGWRVIYDCMDEWENFPQLNRAALALEKDLVKNCDLLVVTAQRLYDKWHAFNRPTLLARNATDFEFYARRCRPNDLLPESDAPVIGYFGAIADWFDVELLAKVAQLRPQYTFVLLGGVFDVNIAPLQSLPNVKLLGQQPYETMPQYLHHFAVCMIPFKVNPITEATDPVKLYEYLSGGKPVVAVKLPELEPYREYLYFAETAEEFAVSLDAAIAEDSPQQAERRKQLARQHTWAQRYQTIAAGIQSVTPKASIIIVTYNNLALTKLCLASVFRNTEYANFEVIVVDNRSSDGTPEFLKTLTGRFDNLKIILNDENFGFAKANNQGIAQAEGEHFVLLNNDAIVPPGWLTRLLLHLRDSQIGLVGPVTNSIGNEARIAVPYQTWTEMEAFARQHTWRNHQLAADIHVLAMYCVALRRDVFEAIGTLDEQFGIGMFEDDDYSERIRQAGMRVLCATDVFVHHFGQAAFGKLIRSGTYDAIFNENRRLYETKWNVTWQPHQQANPDFTPHVFPPSNE
ncbi:MAG TPA: glycosyltransferase, partial [Blastocatellia bacterium]|nr:glycosyltransferase [Blastocatellia bacterium]